MPRRLENAIHQDPQMLGGASDFVGQFGPFLLGAGNPNAIERSARASGRCAGLVSVGR
jgi:hypothetical protein